MRKYLIALLVIKYQFLFSQNLVMNGDFEYHSSLPSFYGELYKCSGWSNLNTGNWWPYASPDYFHMSGTGGVGLPNSIFATINPYSGNAISGFVTYDEVVGNFREYISTKFNSPMTIGEKYRISFWLSNGESNHLLGCSSNRIGVKFTMDELIQLYHEPLITSPQLEILGEVWSTSWQNFSFTFVADSAYNYVTIGNFYNDLLTSTTSQVAGEYVSAYYFIDKIEVIPMNILVIGPNSICLGDTIILEAQNDTIYNWVEMINPNMIISSTQYLQVAPANTTTYLVYGAFDTLSYTVYVNIPPVIDLGPDLIICQNEKLILNVSMPGGLYHWQDSSTSSTFEIVESGQYWVSVNKDNCVVSDSINIEVINCYENLDLPNIFTPNQDGYNDLLIGKISGFINFEFSIYNRWGNKVYETGNYFIRWDGTYNGRDCNDGTYFWILRYNSTQGIQKLNGIIRLVR